MKKLVLAGIGMLFFLGPLGAFCCAQGCATTFNSWFFECDGPYGCIDYVYPRYPEGSSPYGVYVQCQALECCGQLFSDCYGGGGCDDVMLKKPGVKEEIAQLAATSDVLVADCSGRYVSYEPGYPPEDRHSPIWSKRSLALIEERVLR